MIPLASLLIAIILDPSKTSQQRGCVAGRMKSSLFQSSTIDQSIKDVLRVARADVWRDNYREHQSKKVFQDHEDWNCCGSYVDWWIITRKNRSWWSRDDYSNPRRWRLSMKRSRMIVAESEGWLLSWYVQSEFKISGKAGTNWRLRNEESKEKNLYWK